MSYFDALFKLVVLFLYWFWVLMAENSQPFNRNVWPIHCGLSFMECCGIPARKCGVLRGDNGKRENVGGTGRICQPDNQTSDKPFNIYIKIYKYKYILFIFLSFTSVLSLLPTTTTYCNQTSNALIHAPHTLTDKHYKHECKQNKSCKNPNNPCVVPTAIVKSCINQ